MKLAILVLLAIQTFSEHVYNRSNIFFRQGDWQTWIANDWDKNLTNDPNKPPYQITTDYGTYWQLKFNNTGLPDAGVQSKVQVKYMKSLSERIDTPSSMKLQLKISLKNSPNYTNYVNSLFLGFNEYDGQNKNYLDLVFWDATTRAPNVIDRSVLINNKQYFVYLLSPKHTVLCHLGTPPVYDQIIDLEPYMNFLMETNRIRRSARLEYAQYQMYFNRSGLLTWDQRPARFNKECITLNDSRLHRGINFVNDIKNLDFSKMDFSNLTIPLKGGNPLSHFQYKAVNPVNEHLCNSEQYAVIGYNQGKWVTNKGEFNVPIKMKDAYAIKLSFSFSAAQNPSYTPAEASGLAFLKIELHQSVDLVGQPSERIYICPFFSGPLTKKGVSKGSVVIKGYPYDRYDIVQKDGKNTWNEYYFYFKQTVEKVEELDARPFLNEISNLKYGDYYVVALQVGFQFFTGEAVHSFKSMGFVVDV